MKKELTSKEKAILCARWAMEKKAYDLDILNVGELTPVTDYFVICSGRSVRQTKAISDHIQTCIKKQLRHKALGVEGQLESSWILIDLSDVIVHIFYEPTRELFSLEKLWSDAPPVKDPALIALAEKEKAEEKAFNAFDEEDEWPE